MDKNNLRKFIKLYQVSADAVRPDGTIDPKAPLYPYFADFYGTDSEETLESDNAYNGNIHGGRRVTITDVSRPMHTVRDPRTGEALWKVSPRPYGADREITNRGYSGLGYVSKADRKDNVFGDWTRGAGDRHSINRYGQADAADVLTRQLSGTTRGNPASRSDLRRITDNISAAEGRGGLGAGGMRQLDELALRSLLHEWLDGAGDSLTGRVSVPVIAYTDESSLIGGDDFEAGYDPLRDFGQEIQVKRILGRDAIPGAVKVDKGTAGSVMRRRLQGLNGGAGYKGLIDSLGRLISLYDNPDPDLHAYTVAMGDAYDDVDGNAAGLKKDLLSAGYYFKYDRPDPDGEKIADALRSFARGFKRYEGLRSSMPFPGLDTPERIAEGRRELEGLLDTARRQGEWLESISPDYEGLSPELAALYAKPDTDEDRYTYDIDRIMDAFRYDDPLTLSDEQYKFILKDMRADYGKMHSKPSAAVIDALT